MTSNSSTLRQPIPASNSQDGVDGKTRYRKLHNEDPFDSRHLPLLKHELGPEEFARWISYREDYASFRRGNARGARGELKSRAGVEGVCEVSDGLAIPPRTDSPFPASSTLSLEEAIIGLFKPPDPNAVKASKGIEARLQEELGAVESNFLNDETVTTQGVTLEEISDRFRKSHVPAEMGSVDTYMASFVNNTVVDSVHCNAPSMIGHMTMSLPYYIRPLSKLVTAMHQNNVKTETGKTTTFMEREVLAMLHRQFFPQHDDAFYKEHAHNPGTALGLVCSGGTLANISAMWLARNALLRPDESKAFEGAEKEGMMRGMRHYGFEDACFVGTQSLHYSMKKAADVLGLGTHGMHCIPFDDKYQVRLDLMEEEIIKLRATKFAILALVGVAGATETGAIDDLAGIAALAKKYNIHFHVDGAWGGPCIFSKEHSKKMKGIELADTITLDGHKQLYTPMGCGLCLIRDPDLVRFVQKTANYIIRKESFDTGKFTLEGSRPANGVFMHANLEVLGVQGYEMLIDRSIRITRKMADKVLASDEAELIVDPQTNIMLYRFLPKHLRELCREGKLTEEHNLETDEFNKVLQTRQKEIGSTFVSRTTIWSPKYNRDVVALRVVIANPLTTDGDVDTTFNDQMDIIRDFMK